MKNATTKFNNLKDFGKFANEKYEKDILTIPECSKLSNIPFDTILNWVKDGYLKYHHRDPVQRPDGVRYDYRIEKNEFIKFVNNYNSKTKSISKNKYRAIMAEKNRKIWREKNGYSNISELALMTGTSRATISNYIKSKKIQCEKLDLGKKTIYWMKTDATAEAIKKIKKSKENINCELVPVEQQLKDSIGIEIPKKNLVNIKGDPVSTTEPKIEQINEEGIEMETKENIESFITKSPRGFVKEKVFKLIKENNGNLTYQNICEKLKNEGVNTGSIGSVLSRYVKTKELARDTSGLFSIGGESNKLVTEVIKTLVENNMKVSNEIKNKEVKIVCEITLNFSENKEDNILSSIRDDLYGIARKNNGFAFVYVDKI